METRATPLASRTGVPANLLTVDPLAFVAVRRVPSGSLVALISAPADPPASVDGATVLHFGAGSLWIPAPLMSDQAPADGFMGVRVTALDLTIPGPPPARAGDDILIGPADLATLSITPAPRTPSTAFVNDGSVTVAALPNRIVLSAAPDAISVTTLGDAGFDTLGATVSLGGGPAGVGWDAAASEIVIAFASIAPASFVASGSSVFGSTSTLAGQYRLPVARTTPDALGAAATGGVPTAVVSLGLSWRSGTGAVRLGSAQVLAEQGSLGLRALVQQRAFDDAFTMWTATTAGGARATELVFTVRAGAILALLLSDGLEARLVIGAAMRAAIDRPLTVTGAPIALDALQASYSVVRAPDKTTLNLLAGRPPPPPTPVPDTTPEVIAIENALLRTDGVVWLSGAMALDGTQASAGLLIAGMALTDLLPILPDPYVSNDMRLQRPVLKAGLLAEVGWADPDSAGIGFTLLPPNPPPAHDPLIARQPWGSWEALLDVSGRADQLGVYLAPGTAVAGQIVGQTLQLPGEDLGVFTMPHISWEAVIADSVLDPSTGQPVPAPRQWFAPFSPDDGEPARLTLRTMTLVPVEPVAVVDTFVADYAAQVASGSPVAMDAALTLPFGLTAEIAAGRSPTRFTPPLPQLDRLRASFPGYATATQVRMAAAAMQPGVPSLPGFTVVQDGYAAAMLDTTPGDVSSLWNQQFGHGGGIIGGPGGPGIVPIDRIDLSGYGASLFSSWSDPNDGTGITQVRFDVVVGRTAYELVQAQSWILPGRIRVVDTKIFERDADAYVVRHDSGWQPHGDGLFDYPDGVPETGGVTRLARVRNVHPTSLPDVVVGGVTYRPVAFDTDVELDPISGVMPGDGRTRLACRGMVGYLRLGFSPTPPTLAETVALLTQVTALGATPAAGSIAADAAVAGTGFRFSLTAVEVQAMVPVTGVPANIAIALRGTPNLPRDGAWSVTRRTPTDRAPMPVDPHLPVPLVRLRADPSTWHVMEPGELGYIAAGLQPPTQYGLLQSTGTQKLLIEHPRLVDGAALPLQPAQVPRLADVGALLGIPGLLPDLGQLLQLSSLQGLVPTADGFQTNPLTVSQTLDLPETGLILVGPIAVELATASPAIRPVPAGGSAQSTVTLTLDATQPAGSRWSISIDRVAFKLIVAGFGSPDDPLVALTGTLTAREGQPPGLQDIQVRYGQVLSVVTEVLQGIEAVAQFLPGANAGFSVDFAGTSLRIRESVGLPTLPLGFGYLQNIALNMGFDVDVLARTLDFSVGVGSDQDPFDWLVSPLAGNGLISIGAQQALGVRMEAGIGVGLGIDLAIASGSATVTLAVKIDTTQDPFVLLVILTGNASVDVLDGLASASLTLSAGVGVGVKLPPIPLPPPTPQQVIDFAKQTQVTLEAQVAVGIHLSVCWVVHVDWTGYWPFKETVTGAALTDLLP